MILLALMQRWLPGHHYWAAKRLQHMKTMRLNNSSLHYGTYSGRPRSNWGVSSIDKELTFNTPDIEEISRPKRPPPMQAKEPTTYYDD